MWKILFAVWPIFISCNEPIASLELIHALPVSGVENAEPSGLAMYKNELYTISDNHDQTIFKICLLSDHAEMVPAVNIDCPFETEPKLDFEGISIDQHGNFYLVSERQYRILRVRQDGQSCWIVPSLKHLGQLQGIFVKENAALEGIAYVDKDLFVLCAERQPRALAILNLSQGVVDIQIRVRNNTPLAIADKRKPDFSDLCYYRGNLFALQRFASAISRERWDGKQWHEEKFWSYAHIENDPLQNYQDMTFGLAEGLCMDQDKIYIIYDNNQQPRQQNSSDSRPLLLILKAPADLYTKEAALHLAH